MKRDWKLVREILLEVEKKDSPFPDRLLEIDGRTSYEIGYHVKLLYEGGMIDEVNDFGGQGDSGHLYAPGGLTWEGHDFLDSIRHDSVWQKVLDQIAPVGEKVSIGVLKTIAEKAALGFLLT